MSATGSTVSRADRALLEVQDLKVVFRSGKKEFHALKGVNLSIDAGETLGLVGESGSGKTTIGKVILGQVPASSGKIVFDGEDITHATRERRRTLGREIQVVFQDPYGSLNPARSIGDTLSEPLLTQTTLTRQDMARKIAEILEQVGMPTDTASRYPAQFSGGQRQRIAIARAVIGRPRLVVCDEPVSGLDLSVQAQVLNLLNDLQKSMGLALLFISHDLTVVRHVSRRTAVLFRGDIVEQGDTLRVLDTPQHAYTQALLSAAPVPDPLAQRAKREAWRKLQQQGALVA
jgi:ABC-type oligopeptide transport system ATPase subunit